MSKKVSDIRKNIANRKYGKMKSYSGSPKISPILSDDERYSSQPQGFSDEQGTIRLKTTLFPKLLISVFLFFLTFLIYQSEVPFIQKAKPVVQHVMTEDLPFAKMNSWYEAHFGGSFVSLGFDRESPESMESSLLSMPVTGMDAEHITQEGDGVLIEVTDDESVYPLDKGTVLFAGNMPDTGRTIILQHDDGRKSIYGQLDEIDVFHYQSVSANQSIGSVEPDEVLGTSQLYFAIQDGNDFLDPILEIFEETDEN